MRSVVSLVLTLLLLSGCEEPFEPLASSGLAFSIHGRLEATADTQWVRVMPMRESLETAPGPIDAVVTLEELETGTTVTMSESQVRYPSPFVPDGELYAHNFWTTMPMVPGRHYRLTATRSDGAASSATVLIPVWESPTLVVNHRFLFPTTPDIRSQGILSSRGTIGGTRYLGMLFGGLNTAECCEWRTPGPQEYLRITRPAEFEGDDHEVQLSWPTEAPSYVTRLPLRGKLILAVASGAPWPYDDSRFLREESHPSAINNIEGGVGFLIGTNTHLFPFAVCTPLERTILCTITFGPSSATLIAAVTNGCTGEPLSDVQVQLVGAREDGTRSETTGANGKVQFPGLKPGTAYSFTFEAPISPGQQNSDFFPVELADVVFAEAAIDTVSVVMTHRRNCVS